MPGRILSSKRLAALFILLLISSYTTFYLTKDLLPLLSTTGAKQTIDSTQLASFNGVPFTPEHKDAFDLENIGLEDERAHPVVDQKPLHCENPTTDTALIGKVSMVYGELNELYERALKTHQIHAQRQGYKVSILRNTFQSPALSHGYWNKSYYLLSLILAELSKNPADRLQWLMWFDADSILLNPAFPVELFLPPEDFSDVHFLATKDQNGLNSGIIFVRVHFITAEIITTTINLPKYRPEIWLGYSEDQTAMELVFNESGYRQHVVYMPRVWFNAQVNEPEPGDLLIHFPGLVDRDDHMRWWLEQVEGPEAVKWEKDIADTSYTERLRDFWDKVRYIKAVSSRYGEKYRQQPISDALEDALIRVDDVAYYATDNPELMDRVLEELEEIIRYIESVALPDTAPQ